METVSTRWDKSGQTTFKFQCFVKLCSFFRFTKIVKMKKKQQERRKEGSGRGKIEREKGQEGGGKEGEKDGGERRDGETEAEG